MSDAIEVEHLYRTAPIGLCLIDRGLRYLRINDRLAAINGQPAEAHVGRTVWEIVPAVAADVAKTLAEVFDRGEPLLGWEVAGTTPAEPGSPKWWRLNMHPIKDPCGAVVAVSIAVQDITEQKQKDKLVRERLGFEQLLADLSSSFVNIPSDRVDGAVRSGLERVREFLGIDRCSLGFFIDGDRQLQALHSCAAEGVPEFPRSILDHQLPWLFEQVRQGRAVILRRLPEDLPEEAVHERAMVLRDGTVSHLALPFRIGGVVVGGIAYDSYTRPWDWPDELVARLRLLGEVFANALVHQRAEVRLEAALREVRELRDRLEQENTYLRDQVRLSHHHGRILGQSDAIRKVLKQVEQVAPLRTAVLIEGATGTGKELLAQEIHELSPRQGRAMVTVNCASLPATLIESELFGREAGAYTGALAKQIGRFELADDSTLFLDEIGELPVELQAKLLRVLDDGGIERLGSPRTIQTDVRIIAATNRDLEQAIREGKFRADLYHRLRVFPIRVPSLRERREDIPLLVWAFVEEFGRRMGKSVDTIPRRTMEQLQAYPWPGNVRELRNVVERAMILARGPTLLVEVPSIAQGAGSQRLTLDEVQRRHILQVLHETNWRIRGAGGAAAILGLKPTTLEARMIKLGIRRDPGCSDIS